MIAFQKYCEIHKSKMYFFTGFVGLFSVGFLVIAVLQIYKHGIEKVINEPNRFDMVMTGLLEFPAAFIFLLLLHKIFTLYIHGAFFQPHTMKLFQFVAKLAILYGLIVKPAFVLSFLSYGGQVDIDIVAYLTNVDFSVTVIGYILHLSTAAHKISRELEQEQELTV